MKKDIPKHTELKRAEVAIVISHKADFKAKSAVRQKVWHVCIIRVK